MNRRTFISSMALAGTAVAAGPRLFAQRPPVRPKLGIIGCGWYGGVDLEDFQRSGEVEVVSLCDVNARNLDAKLEAVAKHQSSVPRTYSDYRAMLAAERHDI